MPVGTESYGVVPTVNLYTKQIHFPKNNNEPYANGTDYIKYRHR